MKNFIFVLLAFSLFSCGDDTPPGTPSCIDDKLKEFQDNSVCEGDNLASWEFQGETVYCFVSGQCGIVVLIEIYDGNCDLLCTMGSGLTSCNGVPWAENASNETLIWLN